MYINDIVYGPQEIKEPVLERIIQCPTFLRLKYINQAGPSQYLYPWKKISRFDHSVGVMLLLRRYKASLDEQVAGLIHDITHTAFSHVVDFVFLNTNHEYHELFHEKIVKESEIFGYLKQYKISTKVIDPEKFPLLERDMPDLCADRIDYALRDFIALSNNPHSNSFLKLSGLTTINNEFVFKDKISAEKFADDYLFMDNVSWANPREIAIYEIMAQVLLHALEKNILKLSDLFTDDQKVMEILRAKGDPYIRKKLLYMTPKFRIEKANSDHYHLKVKTKTRYIDPKIIVKDTLVRLSEISKPYARKLKAHKENGKKAFYLFIFIE